MTVDTAPRAAGLRRMPWGANLARQASGDPYVKAYEITEGESAMQAMTKAGLDWTVSLRPIGTADESGHFVDQLVPDHLAVTRDDSGLPLAIVKGRYNPFLNRSQFEFVDALVDTSASSHVGAGELDDGRRVYSIVKLDKEIRPKNIPEEIVDVYLVCTNHHTGKASFTASVFPLHGACTNGLKFTFRQFATTWKIRHTGGMDLRLAEAQRALGLSIRYADRFEQEVEELVRRSVTTREFEKIVEEMFPLPDEPENHKRGVTLAENRRDALRQVYFDSPDLQNIHGTGWGVVNAVAEWDQWSKPFRSKYQTREASLLRRITDPNVNALAGSTNQALALVRSL